MSTSRLILFFALIAFVSCKKKKADDTISFNNRLDKQVTVTVYPTMTDYANNTNPVMRKVVKGGEILTLPANSLVSGRTYYMDWYTDDFYTNNWFNDAFPQPYTQVAFTPSNNNSSFYFDPGFTGYARKTYLATNDLFSNWHAVNAYMEDTSEGYHSFWSTMSENERYKTITVTKGFNAFYSYKNALGTMVTDTLNFKVHRTEEAYIEFMNSKGQTLGSMATGRLPTGVAPDYKSSSKDSVLAYLPNSDYYFLMVKD